MRDKIIRILPMLILMILVLAGINYRVNAENENYGISTIEEGMGDNESSGNSQENTGSENTPTVPDPAPVDPEPAPDPEPVNPAPVDPEPVPTVPTTTPTPSTTTNNNWSNNSGSSNRTTKSSDANLSNLGIRPNDFTGFTPTQTTYNVTVPNDVENVEVYATARSSSASIEGTGSQKLQEGANALMVTVTAQDGTKKTYTINVTREAKTQEGQTPAAEVQPEEENTKNQRGLKKLEIPGITLSPIFKTSVYEYTAKYIGEETKIKLQTEATDSNYKVEITGNEDIKEGENVITVLVSDENGENVAIYQILLTKSLIDEEVLAKEQSTKRKIIAGAIGGVILFIIILILIIRFRKNRTYMGVPYSEDEENEEMYDDEEYDENEYDEYENQLEDYDSNMKYQSNNYIDEDIEEIEEDDEENIETIRAQYLNNYNEAREEIDNTAKKSNKGKRYK